MRLALIGLGQAGGKIVDAFLAHESRTGRDTIQAAIAVNTAKADLHGLEEIPEENRHLIGQARVKGHGVGADNELGAEIAEEDIGQIQRAIDDISVHAIDAFLLIAGLGGGTGSGATPVVAKHLKKIYTEPVYALGVLPGSDEGGLYTLNAARSLRTIVDQVDNLLLFDNDAWRQTGESMDTGYGTMNDEIVRRFGTLFGAGEVQDGVPIAESVVDSSEIINTLSGGGISTVGYAVEQLDTGNNSRGLLSRFKSDESGLDDAAATNLITSTVRKATLGRLTLPCEISGVERGLIVAAGPPHSLNRKGLEKGRRWLEDETGSMEIRGGDYPLDTDRIAVVVLLSGVYDSPRIKELQQVATEAQDSIESIRDQSAANLNDLVEDDADDIDPLF